MGRILVAIREEPFGGLNVVLFIEGGQMSYGGRAAPPQGETATRTLDRPQPSRRGRHQAQLTKET